MSLGNQNYWCKMSLRKTNRTEWKKWKQHKKFTKYNFDKCVNEYQTFVKSKGHSPSLRCAKDLNELILAKWAQITRKYYHDNLLSDDQISKLQCVNFCTDPEKQRFKDSVCKFLRDTFHNQVKWIFKQECKEGYFLKKKLNKIYHTLPNLEELAIEVFNIKLSFENESELNLYD